ncbi:substrate-binding domain-containing protein [Chloroflexota bacterium]
MKKTLLLLLPALMILALVGSGPVMAQDDTYVIGVSNGFVGSEWRTQMIQNMEDVVAEFAEKGITIELVIESADVDVQGQVQQVQNLVNRGVDAIIINPNDQAALNLALEDAVAEGIVVIAVDQEISAEGVYNVVIDQNEWAKISARWLVEQLGGAGDVVLIEGFVGHPANEARMDGVEEVFAAYPGINVVGRDTGSWDQATGQQVMSDFLASLPNIDGMWTQDGMAQGALTAVKTANPDEWPVMVGEARAGFLQLWNEVAQENPDFTTFGVVNPPGVGADGVRVAMEMLQGGMVDESQLAGPFGNTLYVPIPYTVDESNFAEQYAAVMDLPESYTLDGFISQDQANSFMVQDWSAYGPYTIGVSNGFVGSEWRTQMIQNIEDVVAEYAALGLELELVIESADVDVQGQVQQIQNLVNRGVDVIIINPNDQAALNLALEDAVAEGIIVIAVDQEISAEGVFNVTIDQNEWAKISARWLVEQLGGAGDVVLIEGFVGHPANEARMDGVEEIFAQYPGINVVGRDTGSWDQATGQQVMSDFLASLPNIDGMWTQDGMAQGALTAVKIANPDEWPVMVGEARAGFLQLWNEVAQENPDFTTYGVVNPPGVGADGLRVAVEMLTGGTPDMSKLTGPFGNTYYVPIPYVVDEFNFAEQYEAVMDLPESYTLDGFITQMEAAGFME